MEPTFVASVNGFRIYRLAFGGYSIKSVFDVLLASCDTLEDAFRWINGIPTKRESSTY